MTTEGRDEKAGLDRDDAALWALLGRQDPPAKASPYFSRRVLREITLAEGVRGVGWWARVRSRWPGVGFTGRGARWPGAAAGLCAVVLVGVLRLTPTPDGLVAPLEDKAVVAATAAVASAQDRSANRISQAVVPAQDVEVIADLDNILQREESRLWTEDTARF